jgi:hypothetical protein
VPVAKGELVPLTNSGIEIFSVRINHLHSGPPERRVHAQLRIMQIAATWATMRHYDTDRTSAARTRGNAATS